jgi:hypothetical protein
MWGGRKRSRCGVEREDGLEVKIYFTLWRRLGGCGIVRKEFREPYGKPRMGMPQVYAPRRMYKLCLPDSLDFGQAYCLASCFGVDVYLHPSFALET